jgi:hypothetical protein
MLKEIIMRNFDFAGRISIDPNITPEDKLERIYEILEETLLLVSENLDFIKEMNVESISNLIEDCINKSSTVNHDFIYFAIEHDLQPATSEFHKKILNQESEILYQINNLGYNAPILILKPFASELVSRIGYEIKITKSYKNEVLELALSRLIYFIGQIRKININSVLSIFFENEKNMVKALRWAIDAIYNKDIEQDGNHKKTIDLSKRYHIAIISAVILKMNGDSVDFLIEELCKDARYEGHIAYNLEHLIANSLSTSSFTRLTRTNFSKQIGRKLPQNAPQQSLIDKNEDKVTIFDFDLKQYEFLSYWRFFNSSSFGAGNVEHSRYNVFIKNTNAYVVLDAFRYYKNYFIIYRKIFKKIKSKKITKKSLIFAEAILGGTAAIISGASLSPLVAGTLTAGAIFMIQYIASIIADKIEDGVEKTQINIDLDGGQVFLSGNSYIKNFTNKLAETANQNPEIIQEILVDDDAIEKNYKEIIEICDAVVATV